jgi:hypothetical protein
MFTQPNWTVGIPKGVDYDGRVLWVEVLKFGSDSYIEKEYIRARMWMQYEVVEFISEKEALGELL